MSTTESLANLNLYMVNRLPDKRYLKFTGIGTYVLKKVGKVAFGKQLARLLPQEAYLAYLGLDNYKYLSYNITR